MEISEYNEVRKFDLEEEIVQICEDAQLEGLEYAVYPRFLQKKVWSIVMRQDCRYEEILDEDTVKDLFRRKV